MATKLGKLYVVSTPIGNRGDFTQRAVETLAKVNCLVAETPLVSKHLLHFLNVRTKLIIPFRENNRLHQLPKIIKLLQEGKTCALVSDAGYPLIADPGLMLVQAIIAKQIPMEVIPGPSAILTALVASGFSAQRFAFLGYFPRHSRQREKFWQTLLALKEIGLTSVIFFEVPSRLLSTLYFLNRKNNKLKLAIAKELTKPFAHVYRGDVETLLPQFEREKPRGEFTVVLGLK